MRSDTPPGHRSPNVALVAGLSLGAAMAGGMAFAQTAPAPAATAVPEVSVTGARPANQLLAPTGNPRTPGTVLEQPATINVVPQEVLQQQGVTSLEQALRNVPGITSTIGEGNGGVTGDQFRIRGFSAQNDILVDGLRDFGSYSRDAFTFEEVQVLKGAAGFATGTSAIGGNINVQTRLPTLENRYAASVTGGMGPYIRGIVDLNQRLSDTIAARVVVMGQSSSLVDRDQQDTNRWGVAPSIAFGLGTNTTFSLDYMHYRDRRTIDSGMPIVYSSPTAIGRPASEYGVRRSNFYGIRNDEDDTTVDRVTGRFSHRFNDWLTVTNDTRYTHVDRTTALSAVSCGTGATQPLYAASCSGQFFRGLNPTLAYGGGSNAPYNQTENAIQNLTTAVARFNTGPLRHELTGGVDFSRHEIDRVAFPYVPTRPTVTLLNPSTNNDLTLLTGAANNRRETELTNLGLFLNERLWLLPNLSVYGGFRWTNYDLDYKASNPATGALSQNTSISDSYWDPRAGVIWEPMRNTTLYYSYSTSTTPPGTFFTTFPASTTTFNSNLEPERNVTHEIGGKVGLFDNRLGLTLALFHSEKGNATVPDGTGGVIATGDRQRVRGVEVGVTGRITPEWNVNAAYTYLDSETTRSLTAANVGKRVQYVPEHAASVWTTYDIARDTPYNVTLGAGVTWRGQVYLAANSTAEVPANVSLDALIQHRVNDKLTLRLNGYNLTDRTNYEGLFGNRAVVAAGRTVLFTANVEF